MTGFNTLVELGHGFAALITLGLTAMDLPCLANPVMLKQPDVSYAWPWQQ